MRDRGRLIGAFAAVYLVWGSTYLAIAWAVEGIVPMLMIGARCLIAGGVLYGWARWRGSSRPAAADWLSALVVGTLLFVTGQAMLAWAETRIASGPAAVLLATEPMFIALFAWRGGRLLGIARGERPNRRVVLAMVVGLGGVASMAAPGGIGAVEPWGAGATLLASASWSAGMLRARARPGQSPSAAAGMQLLGGGIVLLLASLVTGGLGTDSLVLTTRSAMAFGYLVVFGSVITFGAYVWLLDRVGATRLSTHAYVNPVVAVALGVALGGERLSPALLVASALILVSVALMVRKPAPAGQSPLPRRGVILQTAPCSSSVTT